MIVVVITVPYISGPKIDRMIAYESSVDGFTGSCWILNGITVVGHCVLGDPWKEWDSWHVIVEDAVKAKAWRLVRVACVIDWIVRRVLDVLVVVLVEEFLD